MGTRPDGSVDRRHVTATTKKSVTDKVKSLERARDTGQYAQPGVSMTVADWLTQWVETIAAPTVRAKSLAAYRTAVNRHLIPGLGKHRLRNLRAEHVEKFYADMSTRVTLVEGQPVRRTYRPATIQQVHRTLRTALEQAKKRDHIARNPAQYAAVPASQHIEDDDAEVSPLTLEQVKAVITAAQGVRNGQRYVLALALGLRQGESIGLEWKHLALDSNPPLVLIRQQLQRHTWQHGCTTTATPTCGSKRGCGCPQRHDGGLVLTQTKSKAGRRTIGIPPECVEYLRGHRAAQAAERLKAGNEWQENGLVFAQPNGKPVDPRADLRDWKRLLVTAGVPEFRLHDARHTSATLLLVERVDPRTVMDVMGWSNISMLHRYQHVADNLRADAAERIGAALYGS